MRTSRRLSTSGTLLFAGDARRQLAAGETRRAIETCKMGLARHPDHAAGYVVLAAAYRSVGEDERARRVLERGYERTGLDQLRELAAALQAGEPSRGDAPSSTVPPVSTEPSPERNGSGAHAPASHSSGAVESQKPEAETADRSAAMVSQPTPETLETAEPADDRPEVAQPEVQEPEVAQPDVAHPDVEKPEVAQPDVAHPEVDKPEVEKPEVDRPEVAHPEVEKPEVTRPEAALPEVTRPEAALPEIIQPEVIQSEGTQPQVTQPEAALTEVVKPEVAQPDVEKPEIAQPVQEHPVVEAHPVESRSAPAHVAMATDADASPSDPLEGEEEHSPLELVEEGESAQAAREGAAPAGALSLAERPAERAAERLPWFQRRPARAGERTGGSSLALHSGKSAHRLTSANLRLIPGLEYAPLRAEDQGRRMMIAPIMEEPLPDWEPRRRMTTVENAPPLPEYPPAHEETRDAHRAEDSIGAGTLAAQRETVAEELAAAPSRAHATAPVKPAASQQEWSAAAIAASATAAAPSRGMGSAAEADTSAIDELARRLEGARITPVGEVPAGQRHVFEPSIVSDTLADILVAQGAYGEAMKAFMTLARMRPAQLRYYEERIAEMKRRIVEERTTSE